MRSPRRLYLPLDLLIKVSVSIPDGSLECFVDVFTRD